MSILSTDLASTRPPEPAHPATALHQSSSGRLFRVWAPGWWGWLDRPFQRIALREIAEDPHLLGDLGLTREQALREAAKPFWR